MKGRTNILTCSSHLGCSSTEKRSVEADAIAIGGIGSRGRGKEAEKTAEVVRRRGVEPGFSVITEEV